MHRRLEYNSPLDTRPKTTFDHYQEQQVNVSFRHDRQSRQHDEEECKCSVKDELERGME